MNNPFSCKQSVSLFCEIKCRYMLAHFPLMVQSRVFVNDHFLNSICITNLVGCSTELVVFYRPGVFFCLSGTVSISFLLLFLEQAIFFSHRYNSIKQIELILVTVVVVVVDLKQQLVVSLDVLLIWHNNTLISSSLSLITMSYLSRKTFNMNFTTQ